MKVMLQRDASEEEQQRFLQEARVLGQLAHPNIVPVHDVGTDETGRLFYTMKLVLGGTLHDVIGKLKSGDKGTLAKYPLNALLTVFQKVCDAVAFAHSRGIIHRDLKPQNIMVGEFGEVLVMDWGLAKILPGSAAAEEAARTLPWLGPVTAGATGSGGPVRLAGAAPAGGSAASEMVTLPLSGKEAKAEAVTLPPVAPPPLPAMALEITLPGRENGAGSAPPNAAATAPSMADEPPGANHSPRATAAVGSGAGTEVTLPLDNQMAQPAAPVFAGTPPPEPEPQTRQPDPGSGSAPAPSGVYATLEGAVMGTPHFMSPEQAEGKIAELDGRSDIFSLGGILYALLTLRPPVEGDSLEEILSKVRSGTIAPPTAFDAPSSTTQAKPNATGAVTEPRKIHPLPHCPAGKVPAALSAVTMKALTRDKLRRYQTVAEFTRDIEAYQGGFATSAENANALTLVRLFIHRHKTLTAAAALFVLLTIGFVTKVIASEQKARTNAEQAAAHAKTAEEHAARAKVSEAAAVAEKEAARLSSTRANLALADAALREGNGPAMQAALAEVPEDLRDSTWRYLLGESDSSIARIRTGASVVTGVAAHPRRPGVFAVADGNRKVFLIELRTGARLLEFTPEFPPKSRGELSALAFSPDGQRIAVGRSADGGIVIHSARDGKKLLGWDAPRTQELEFSADGLRLFQSTEVYKAHKSLRMWEAASGLPAWEYGSSKGTSHPHGAFTPDGQQVLTFGYGDDFRLVDARDGAAIRSFKREGAPITALAMAGNGLAAAADQQGFVSVLDLKTGSVRLRFRVHDTSVHFLAFTPAGDQLATGVALPDGQQAIHLWLAATGERRQALLGGSGEIRDISVHPVSGELLVSGPNAAAWDPTGQPPRWYAGVTPLQPARPVFWGSDEVLFASGNREDLLLHKLQPGAPAILWKSVGIVMPQSDVSADGKLAVFAGVTYGADLLFLRNPGPQREEGRTIKLQGGKDFIRLSAGGERVVVVGNRNSKVDLFDTTTGLPLAPFERADMKRFWSFAWLGSNGQHLVGLVTAKAERGLAGSEEWVVLWDAASGKIVQRVTNRSALGVLVVAPDGSRLAEAGADKMVRIRDAATLAVQQEFRAHDGPITALAWHPVKPILATTSTDLTIRLWNLETGRRLEELRGPLTTPMGLGFSPSGQRLACASPSDNTRIWEPESLNEKPVPTQPKDGAWEDLLAPLTPAIVDQTGNGWRMDNGALFSPNKTFTTLPLPGNLSGTSYQVRVKLRQLMAKNGFSLELPVGNHMVGFDLDGDLGKWTSLALANGKWGKGLPGALAGKQVKDSDQHDLEVTVRLNGANATITVTLDDQPLYEWTGPIAALSQHSLWKTAPGSLALGTMAADWVVYEVKVKRLDGK